MNRRQSTRSSHRPAAAAAGVLATTRTGTSWTPRTRLVEQVRQAQSRLRPGRSARGLASTSR